jgi:hypothetical protein
MIVVAFILIGLLVLSNAYLIRELFITRAEVDDSVGILANKLEDTIKKINENNKFLLNSLDKSKTENEKILRKQTCIWERKYAEFSDMRTDITKEFSKVKEDSKDFTKQQCDRLYKTFFKVIELDKKKK